MDLFPVIPFTSSAHNHRSALPGCLVLSNRLRVTYSNLYICGVADTHENLPLVLIPVFCEAGRNRSKRGGLPYGTWGVRSRTSFGEALSHLAGLVKLPGVE